MCALGLGRCKETTCRVLGEPGTSYPKSSVWEVQKELEGIQLSPHESLRLECQLRPLVLETSPMLPLGPLFTMLRTFQGLHFTCPQLHCGADRADLSFHPKHTRPGGASGFSDSHLPTPPAFLLVPFGQDLPTLCPLPSEFCLL